MSLGMVLLIGLFSAGSAKAFSGYFYGETIKDMGQGDEILINCNSKGKYVAPLDASDETKQNFINDILGYLDANQPGNGVGACSDRWGIGNTAGYDNTEDHVGGAYIINDMINAWGGPTKPPTDAQISMWESSIKNPDIEINYQDYDYGNSNSAFAGWHGIFYYEISPTDYTGDHDDTNQFTDNCTNNKGEVIDCVAKSLVFKSKSTGTVYYAIKANCGNPVGNLPGLPNTWSLSVASTVSPTTVTPNVTATFNHTVTNSGPDDMKADFNRTISSRYYTAATNTWSGWITRSGPTKTDPLKDGENVVTTDTYVFPNSAKDNDEYCEEIGAKPGSSDHPDWTVESGPPGACVTLNVPVTSSGGYTLNVNGSNYEKGSNESTPTVPVTFTITPIAPCISGTQIIWMVSGPYLSTKTITSAVNGCNAITDTENIPKSSLDNGSVGSQIYTIAIQSINGSSSSLPASVNGSILVYEVPYVRFYGNDIHATGGEPNSGLIYFNENDSSNGASGNRPSNELGAGSGTEYASIAANALTLSESNYATVYDGIGIDTAVFRDSTSTAARTNGLKTKSSSISNSEIDLSNYIYPATTGSGNYAGGDISSLNGYYDVNSSDVPVSGSIGSGQKVTINAIDGSIVINNNITTSGAAYDANGNFSDSNTPVVLLIASNNIYIGSQVNRIDAILIAKGTIYTCADTSLDIEIPSSNWSSCTTNLTINGAVGAANINFDRSVGTRLKALQDETTGATGLASAAETINFPSYLYFATPYLENTGSSGYQAVFNAAPLL